ncbi:hypothetical protein [Erysipelothrix aquatica]|uniref:hypothetical protein n=1 Tax=Erysipelothrix aquatica TaxID=2683714 RepID=UPI00135B90B5|nr:hypothetical protein [Erysipelothrix aquatica]
MSFEDFCSINNIVISIKENMGTNIRGFCYFDGLYFNVILNNRFDRFQLQETTVHEVIHVMKNHFSCNTEDILSVEREVDSLTKVMKLVFV